MTELEIFSMLKTWVALPIIGTLSLICAFFWSFRKDDRADLLKEVTYINASLSAIETQLSELNVRYFEFSGRFDERLKALERYKK